MLEAARDLKLCSVHGRAMAELRILRLFGNPLEFLPEILPLQKLCHLSVANVRIVADENLRSVDIQIEVLKNFVPLFVFKLTLLDECTLLL